MYKEDLTIKNLQCVICHKTKPNQTKLKSKDKKKNVNDFNRRKSKIFFFVVYLVYLHIIAMYI